LGVGERPGPPAVEGEVRGVVGEDEEAPGTAARLGAAPVEVEGPRAPAGTSLRLGRLRRDGVQLGGRGEAVMRGEEIGVREECSGGLYL
jgi:hypothetical protein